MGTSGSYDEFFGAAAGAAPFPYQRRLADSHDWPARIEVATGLGKTLAVVVAWLWRRREGSAVRSRTPRRLVYCLPMRVLVEQTRDVVADVVARLGLSTRVVVLMGGVDDEGGWDVRPEDDAIIIGTQDMLLSRALNRGYGMSRYRWPLHFGLLNNDALWVVDEVQLMGTGLATTAQLQGLRRKLGTVLPSQTSWMSATLEESWLRTVDVDPADVGGHIGLDDSDRADPVVARRVGARKSAAPTNARMGDTRALSAEILALHRPATRTLVVMNTVDRARELFQHLRKAKPEAALTLIHSRFRRRDRESSFASAVADPGPAGTIVVSTQVIEAGVDLTSATLVTELAPWSSLVQRFGRCNRRGEDADARVRWIPLPQGDRERAKLERPYSLAAMLDSQTTLEGLAEVGPAALPKKKLTLEAGLVLRRRDLIDLFDTTADLGGNDVDVSRFIRDVEDHDVQLCWRDIGDEPAASEPSPSRDELCAASVAVARDWLRAKTPRAMWAWDGLAGRWARVDAVRPGMTLLLRARDGGYDGALGLDPKGTASVAPVPTAPAPREHDRQYDGDPESEWRVWYALSKHSDDVAVEAETIASSLGLAQEHARCLVTAGRWHDAGKAHPVWQAAAKRLGAEPPAELVAKSQVRHGHIRYEGRPGFRHELASALLALEHGLEDLVCFLVAAHHGKVRLGIRSFPIERAPKNERNEEDRSIRYARGVWEGDDLPDVDLGGGLVVPATRLTLAYMELGDDPETGPSWSSRMLALRDDPELGPFRLGFLEGLIKAADERASARTSGEEAAQ